MRRTKRLSKRFQIGGVPLASLLLPGTQKQAVALHQGGGDLLVVLGRATAVSSRLCLTPGRDSPASSHGGMSP